MQLLSGEWPKRALYGKGFNRRLAILIFTQARELTFIFVIHTNDAKLKPYLKKINERIHSVFISLTN